MCVCSHYVENITITPESFLGSLCIGILPNTKDIHTSWHLRITDLLFITIVLPFLAFHINEIIRSVGRRWWHPTPVLLPGKPHGRRSLVGCSPWGRKELDTTERLHFHFSLSCIGEGNGNPLQYSYLENPRDGGAWWVGVYGVAQSQTRLKRLSSSCSMLTFKKIIDC